MFKMLMIQNADDVDDFEDVDNVEGQEFPLFLSNYHIFTVSFYD